jgi:hypothetical protein
MYLREVFVSGLTDKLAALEQVLSDENGGFNLFAIIMRPEPGNRYELVLCAPWLDEASKTDVDMMISRVRDVLTEEELEELSAVVILPLSNPVVTAITSNVGANHNWNIVFEQCIFSGLLVKHATIITSQRIATPKQ